MIAHDPLHRSGQAELPHPALALGRDAIALVGPRVVDADGRDPSVDVPIHSFPRDAVGLTSSPKRVPPEPDRAVSKRPELRAIARHPVVAEVPVDDAAQVGALLWDGVVHADPQLGFHLARQTGKRSYNFPSPQARDEHYDTIHRATLGEPA